MNPFLSEQLFNQGNLKTYLTAFVFVLMVIVKYHNNQRKFNKIKIKQNTKNMEQIIFREGIKHPNQYHISKTWGVDRNNIMGKNVNTQFNSIHDPIHGSYLICNIVLMCKVALSTNHKQYEYVSSYIAPFKDQLLLYSPQQSLTSKPQMPGWINKATLFPISEYR